MPGKTYTLTNMMAAAKATGRAVRWWEEQGLLGTVERSPRGHRVYTPAQIERAKFIGAAQAAGYTLEQIRAGTTYSEVRGSLIVKIAEAQGWLKELPEQEYDL